MPNKLSRFWQELKRRNVTRVITVYAAASFVILELVSIIVEPLKLPEWTLPMIIVLICVGFIIAVIISWIYDIHPEGGVVKTEPADKVKTEDIPKSSNTWKIASYISFVVVVGLIVLNIFPRINGSEESTDLETSIAVLPFDSWNSDNEYQYLGDAFADEIILQLWDADVFDRVLSRTSTMHFKNERKTIPEIAERLGVNYLIEGSIQRQGDKVSIRVQVIRARKEDHIWVGKYEGDWSEISLFQNDIAKKVARELKVVLSPSQLDKIEHVPTQNLEAYDSYLLGKHWRSQKTPEALLKAMEFFERAIEADPSFIRAYHGLARCYGNLVFYGSLNPEEAYPRALELANHVLNLDNISGEAYDIIGTVNLFYRFDFATAEENFRKAIELEPNIPEILKSYSELLFFKGQFKESTEMDRKALLLDPMYPFEDGLFGVHLYFAGQKDSAISLLRTVSSQKEGMKLFLGIMMLYEGDYEKAINELEKTLSDFSPFSIAQLGLAYSKFGAIEEVSRMLDTLETRARTQYVPYSLRGALKAELGQKKEAMDYLRRGFEEREEHILLMLNVDTLSYASLRSDPEFMEIMENVRTGT